MTEVCGEEERKRKKIGKHPDLLTTKSKLQMGYGDERSRRLIYLIHVKSFFCELARLMFGAVDAERWKCVW